MKRNAKSRRSWAAKSMTTNATSSSTSLHGQFLGRCRGWAPLDSQKHATDPDLLEHRLGSAQSKGCIRIPASLNRLLDHYGVRHAGYEQALREGRKLWILDAQRKPVPNIGRYLIVVESGRKDRPE